MKIGDYVKVTCWTAVSFGYIMGFEMWEDDLEPYEMIEILCDNGEWAFLPNDCFEVLS
jgi:hypothetical protein